MSTARALSTLLEGAGGFVLEDLVLGKRGTLEARYEAGPATLLLVADPSKSARGIRFTRSCVRYAVEGSPPPSVRDAVMTLVGALGRAYDTFCDDNALGHARPFEESPMDPETVRARLEPWLGDRLASVRGRDSTVVVEIASGSSRYRIDVRAGGEEPIVTGRGELPPGLAAVVRFALLGGGSWRRGATVEAGPGDQALLLQLDGPCGQACSFCSVPASLRRGPARDGGDRSAEIEAAAARGVRTLWLQGVDPLASPDLLSVLATARRAGFSRVDLHSPSRRYADRDFLRALLDAAPDDVRFYMPLYGVRADTHDRIVGRAGAHAELHRALDAVTAARGSAPVTIATVVLRDNAVEIPALLAWARSRELCALAQLPYTEGEASFDERAKPLPSQTELVRALVSTEPPISSQDLVRILGLFPCVVLREAGAHDEALARLVHAHYFDPATCPLAIGHAGGLIDCPHAERCALSRPCGARISAAYVAEHGDRELCPVEPGGVRVD